MVFVRLPEYCCCFATMPVRYIFRDPSVGTLAYQIKADVMSRIDQGLVQSIGGRSEALCGDGRGQVRTSLRAQRYRSDNGRQVPVRE
jgi:hypothetical protein